MLTIKDSYKSQSHTGTTFVLTMKPNSWKLFNQNVNCETNI